jgi:hypothetical protein
MRACASACVLPSRSIRRCNCTHSKQGVMFVNFPDQNGNASTPCDTWRTSPAWHPYAALMCCVYCFLVLCGACSYLHCWCA